MTDMDDEMTAAEFDRRLAEGQHVELEVDLHPALPLYRTVLTAATAAFSATNRTAVVFPQHNVQVSTSR